MKYHDSLVVGAWIPKARPRDDSVLKDMLTSQSSKDTDEDGENLANNREDAMSTDQP